MVLLIIQLPCCTVCGNATFWEGVVNLVSYIVAVKIPLEPKLLILRIYPEHFSPGHKAKVLIDMCLLQAKRVIALKWKSMACPTLALWLQLQTNLCGQAIVKYGTLAIPGK